MISLKDHRPSTAKLKRDTPEKIAQPELDRQEKEASTVLPCCLNDGASGGNNEPRRGVKTLTIGFGLLSGDPCFIHLHADNEEGRAFLNLCLKKIMKKHPYRRMLKLYARGHR
jgi:hypothetical protein